MVPKVKLCNEAGSWSARCQWQRRNGSALETQLYFLFNLFVFFLNLAEQHITYNAAHERTYFLSQSVLILLYITPLLLTTASKHFTLEIFFHIPDSKAARRMTNTHLRLESITRPSEWRNSRVT